MGSSKGAFAMFIPPSFCQSLCLVVTLWSLCAVVDPDAPITKKQHLHTIMVHCSYGGYLLPGCATACANPVVMCCLCCCLPALRSDANHLCFKLLLLLPVSCLFEPASRRHCFVASSALQAVHTTSCSMRSREQLQKACCAHNQPCQWQCASLHT